MERWISVTLTASRSSIRGDAPEISAPRRVSRPAVASATTTASPTKRGGVNETFDHGYAVPIE
uniref:Uncharacterized protein n=1 Tax=Oryza punctata TaxID=4537 RepID=A0A0E0K3J5_ORYPU